MGRINLQSLIDEVLEMVKHKQNEDKRLRSDQELARVNQSWDDTPAGQAYWKDIRGRNTAIEVGKMQNAGQMDVARENNAGQMARQALMEDTKRADDVRDYNLNLYKEKVNENVARFNAQTLRKESDWKINQSQKGVLGDQLKAATAILEDMNSTDEDKKMARDFIFGSFKQPATQQQSGTQRNIIAPSGDDRDSFITPGANTKQPSAPGSQSMTFPTNMGTAGKNPLRERAEVEDSFYRMNPHLKRKKKDSLFAF